MVLRQVLGALARGDDLEARGTAPVDHLADERRLVAVGERVDDARRARALGEQRSGERVGFDVHHHDVLAVTAAGEDVADAGGGVPGGVDHDLDLGRRDGGKRVVRDAGRAVTCGFDERARGDALGGPADSRKRCACASGLEVGHRDDVDSRRVLGLRQIHRAELAGADQRHAQGPAFRPAREQHAVEVHTARAPTSPAPAPAAGAVRLPVTLVS